MGQFKGTIQEFKRYIGPFCRNLIQQITRKQKETIGACERCGAVGELEAAHVHGRDRNDIINLLFGTSDSDAFVDVDLKCFEQAFKREHDPIEKVIRVLCNSCHNDYDKKTSGIDFSKREGKMQKHFEKYLTDRGYRTITKSGKPSTVSQYAKGVDAICQREGLSWDALASKISTIVKIYDIGGKKQHIGERSHKTVINALRRFEEFVRETRTI